MNIMVKLATVVMFSTFLLNACGDMLPTDDRDDSFMIGGKSDEFNITESSPEAVGVLRVANECDRETLESAVGLDSRASDNIIAYRSGDDEVSGTNDDKFFKTLTELDAVPYVGPIAFRKMLDYAKSKGWLVVDLALLCPDSRSSVRTVDIEVVRSAVKTALEEAKAIAKPSNTGETGSDWVDLSQIGNATARKVFQLIYRWDGVSGHQERFFNIEQSLLHWSERLDGADIDKNGKLSDDELSILSMPEVRLAIGLVSSCIAGCTDTVFVAFLKQIFLVEGRELRLTDFYSLAWLGQGMMLTDKQAEIIVRILHERGALTFVANVADSPIDRQMLTFEKLRSKHILWDFLPPKFTNSAIYYDHMETIPSQHILAATHVGVDFRMEPAAEIEEVVRQFAEVIDIPEMEVKVNQKAMELGTTSYALNEHHAIDLLRAAFGHRADRIQIWDLNAQGDPVGLFCTMQTLFDQLTPPMLHESHPRAQYYRDGNRAAWRAILDARYNLNRSRPVTDPMVPDMDFDFIIPPALGELLPVDQVQIVPTNRQISADQPLPLLSSDQYLDQVSGFNAYLKQYLPSAVLSSLDLYDYQILKRDGFVTSDEFNRTLLPQPEASWMWGGPRIFDPSDPTRLADPYDMGYPYPWKEYTIGPNWGNGIKLPFAVVPRAMQQIRDAMME